MAKIGIVTPKGVHVGIHCLRHGVTTELLEAGTPIHVVTRLMRHGDSKVTLNHYAHVVGDAERAFWPLVGHHSKSPHAMADLLIGCASARPSFT